MLIFGALVGWLLGVMMVFVIDPSSLGIVLALLPAIVVLTIGWGAWQYKATKKVAKNE